MGLNNVWGTNDTGGLKWVVVMVWEKVERTGRKGGGEKVRVAKGETWRV